MSITNELTGNDWVPHQIQKPLGISFFTFGTPGKPALQTGIRIAENISVGLSILFIGLFRKVIIADSLAVLASTVFQAAEPGITLTTYEAWIGALGALNAIMADR